MLWEMSIIYPVRFYYKRELRDMSLNFPYQNHYSGVIRRHAFQTIGNRLKLKKWFSVYPYYIGILHANHCSKYLMVAVRVKLEKNQKSFKSFSNFKTNECEAVRSRCIVLCWPGDICIEVFHLSEMQITWSSNQLYLYI